MFDKHQGLLRLLIPYSLWTAAGLLGGSLAYLYFMDAGIGLVDLVSSFFFWALAPIIVMALLNGRKADALMLVLSGILMQAIAYMLLASLAPTRELLFAYCFLTGTTCFLFWVPFNSLFFTMGKGNEASLSSVYFSMSPMLGIVLPLAAGIIAHSFGFPAMYALSAFTYLMMLALVVCLRGVGRSQFSYGLGKSFITLKGFKTLVLLEGIYGGGIPCAIAVISLQFFSTPQDLGLFLSATALFSVIASFVVSSLSDRSGLRKKYVRVFSACLGAATASGALAFSPLMWSASVSGRNFFATLFYPFTTAIIMDSGRDMKDVMAGREFILNFGRLIGIGIVFICTVALHNIQLSMLALGALIMLYPLVIELKKRHIRVS